MRVEMPPQPQYTFMAWYSVKAQGQLYLYIREIGRENVDWIHLAQDRYQWRALVNMVMKLRVP
jgi:hypothetical protein